MIQYPDYGNSNEADGTLDLTALIDVIFTLIIFLILTMGTTQVMTEINVTRSNRSQLPAQPKADPLVIEVSHVNKFWKTHDFTVKNFAEFKNQFLSQYGKELQRPVVLALDRTLPVENLITLMDFLSKNGFTNIQIVSEWMP
ncbi:biopolymer transporter ExbD [bacterium]|nr:biopolymer transporter ExbD [bacterium]